MSNLYRKCQVCEAYYGPGTRNRKQFLESKFCSLTCSGKAQRNTVADLRKRIVVNPTTNCHVWTGEKTWNGYGRVGIARKHLLMHRVMWEDAKGLIPPELQIDHMCGVKACCNVEHLRLVTARENSLADTSNNMAARHSRKTECSKCGGPFSTFPNGYRYCKPCRNMMMMLSQRKRRARKGT